MPLTFWGTTTAMLGGPPQLGEQSGQVAVQGQSVSASAAVLGASAQAK